VDYVPTNSKHLYYMEICNWSASFSGRLTPGKNYRYLLDRWRVGIQGMTMKKEEAWV